jgi:hypothetical protein
MSSTHGNKFYFKYQNDMSISFEYNNEYIVTDGQQLTDVSESDDSDKRIYEINIEAGRKGSSDCADWYKESVGKNSDHMIHTEGGDHSPDKLNFAIKGTLTLDGTEYTICLGQGHNSNGNNWHLASSSIEADENGKNGELNSQYRLSQDGSNAMVITLVNS